MHKIIQLYAAYATTDEYGRRGELLGVFENEADAARAVKGAGWYGDDGTVDEVAGLQVVAEGQYAVYLLASEYAKNVRPIELNVNLPAKRAQEIAAAKAKLTAKERKLLGVDDE